MPEISIVLPSYNGERYIKESVNSIIKQSFTDWELIIVDDCSTDNTLTIAETYAQQDKRIKVIHNEHNQKLPESLNIGFRQANGKYLTWTSDDNMYMSNALLEMHDFLEKRADIPMVTANFCKFGDCAEKEFSYEEETIYWGDSVGACFLYRREVLDSVGEYNSEMFLVEDYEYWLRIMLKYGKIGHLDKCLYYYRYHGGSLTLTRTEEIAQQLFKLRIKYIDDIIPHIQDNKKVCTMYYLYFKQNNCLSDRLKNQLFAIVPALSYDVFPNSEKPYIIFGAGEVGRKVCKELGNKAAYFVDSSVEKTGKIIDGLKVLGLNEMLEKYAEYNVILAVGNEKVHELTEYMYSKNLFYCTYTTWLISQQ